jgi:hypothetical protein
MIRINPATIIDPRHPGALGGMDTVGSVMDDEILGRESVNHPTQPKRKKVVATE